MAVAFTTFIHFSGLAAVVCPTAGGRHQDRATISPACLGTPFPGTGNGKERGAARGHGAVPLGKGWHSARAACQAPPEHPAVGGMGKL